MVIIPKPPFLMPKQELVKPTQDIAELIAGAKHVTDVGRTRPTVTRLLVCLRGPDSINHDMQSVKHIVTSRIRGMLFVDYPGEIQFRPLNPRDLEHLADIVKSLQSPEVEGWHHFRDHLASAVEYSQLHPLWSDLGSTLVYVLVHSQLPSGWRIESDEWYIKRGCEVRDKSFKSLEYADKVDRPEIGF